MRISYKQLKKLPVMTESGMELGSVHDIILDVDTQGIVQYEISPSMLSTKAYVVNQDQVVSITSEKMIVKDAVVRDEVHAKELKAQGKMKAEPIAMREEG
ncbi:MAG: hypothetical protein CO030_03050 [Candidatus Magasanikbacteria bacterium CG_4_9_14_0_2_um_filter_42_11]|uniref:PRC-barrel domain-containing protein n=1 Tax=Candidatus Magasanikbacteria bacterium CG_4_9_14_0_2_um_filter_42_11 TaxID=1974643 RepID=A0A2M8F9I7_9BACT|nr:MAG: hypothetical protein COU34_05625 [Candidatus Magasanikbacteria bacterium CG10_big_fil_rev_8_21_14_0_10_43_9]PIY92404.1 MAG: hypothetical protein COY70_03435 [Candidatus Magasanikbacteria bacterium CG_4_10_14_0_8_um_filter_42_12]PJC52402.1 MAG: hypothetical protein CO030_03050 [Candidatus Magasanikbacteria bacterium CG_4_9_14_0_2_um_filter_42_11]